VRVLVVDDSAFMRKVIGDMIKSDPALEVVGIARDGAEGVEKAKQLKPDLITLDIEMPRLNGIDALKQILKDAKTNPPAVLMCSSLTVDGSTEALKAMQLGASDFIAKDPQVVGRHDQQFQSHLLNKLKAIGSHRRKLLRNTSNTEHKTDSVSHHSSPLASDVCTSFDNWTLPEGIEIIVIGSSTGGPPVLEKLFHNLPATLPVPIIVAQHMPELFTRSLAKRIDSNCKCGAVLADHGTAMVDPMIYIAQGGKHIKPTLVAGKKLIARTMDTYAKAIYKPSVDLLFSCAAEFFGSGVLAIQLTGMGEDGALGAQKIREAGGHVIAQDEQSCVVFGMPRAVIENGSANTVLCPVDLKRVLNRVCDTTQSGGENHPPVHRKSA
jgi:two-component system, chemotaxis family, protein-glutamate methylesterase/glutaminase